MALFAHGPGVLAFGVTHEGLYHNGGTFPLLDVRTPVPRAGALSNFRVEIFSNTLDASAVFRVLINGTIITSITITAGFTGKLGPNVGPFPVAATGAISFKVETTGSTGGSMTAVGSVEYVPS